MADSCACSRHNCAIFGRVAAAHHERSLLTPEIIIGAIEPPGVNMLCRQSHRWRDAAGIIAADAAMQARAAGTPPIARRNADRRSN